MASTSEIRAGKAFVELTTKDQALQEGLTRARQRLANFATGLRTAGLGMMAFGTAIVAPITMAAQQYAAAGARYLQIAARTGMAVQQISTLEYAARASGIAIEAMESAIAKMQRQIVAAAGGSYEAAAGLARLGLTAQDLARLTPEQQFLRIGDALSKVANPTERAALAMELFGGAGTAMLPLLENGAEGIRKLQERAAALGSQMSEQDARAAAEFNRRLIDLREVTTNLWTTIGSAVLPALRSSTILMTNITNAVRRWVDQNRGLVNGLFQAGKIIGTIGAALIGLSVATQVASYAMAGLTTVATIAGTVIGGAFAVITSPIGLIIAALAGAVAYLAWFTETGRAAANSVIGFFGRIWEAIQFVFANTSTASGAWSAILAEGAFFAREAWVGFKAFFVDLWIDLKGWFTSFLNSEGWGDAFRKLGGRLLEIWAGVMKAWQGMTNAIADYIWEKFYASDQEKKMLEIERQGIAQAQAQVGKTRADGSIITQADADEAARKIREKGQAIRKSGSNAASDDAAMEAEYRRRLQAAKDFGKDLTPEERAQRQAAAQADTQKQHAENAAKSAEERAKIEDERKAYEQELARKHKASGAKSLSDQIRDLFKGIEAPALPELRKGAVDGMNEAFKMAAPSGTFNPFAAAAMQDPRPSRIAAATERTAAALDTLLDRVRTQGALTFE